MEASTKVVSIPTFVNPHLFWMIEPANSERIKTLNNVNQVMHDEFKNLNCLNDNSFEVGDIVAVHIYSKYYRAMIEDVSKVENKNKNCILCWLIDYGTMYETEVVYKLPNSLRKVAPLAAQGSLHNVVYIRQHLTYDQESGLPIKNYETQLTPTSVAHQISLELMSSLSNLQFKVENKVNGVFLGDILYRDNEKLKSLRQSLIDRGILSTREILFEEIQDYIYNYKETHLWLIAQICKKTNSVQFLNEIKDNRCEQIITKYLAEFENNDIFDDAELTGPFQVRRSRSRNTNDSVSDIESSSSTNEKSPGTMTRAKMFLEKMKSQKDVSKTVTSSDTSESNSSFGKNCDEKEHIVESTSSSQEGKSNRKLVFNEKDVPQSDSLDEEYNKEKLNPECTKRRLPMNAVCIPGGASFTLQKRKTTTHKLIKDTVSVLNTASDEDTSDCKSVIVTKRLIENKNIPSDENSTNEEYKDKIEDEEKDVQIQNLTNVPTLQIKSFCSCKQCDHWTNDGDWQTDTKFLNDTQCTKHLTINKPQSLFAAEEQKLVTIISLNYSRKTKIQKQATPKLLVHSEYLQTPVRLVSEVCFHQCIRDSLRQLKYEEAKRIQMYTWPAILRLQHVVVVNGPQTGKTMAYLPPILTFLLEKNERYEPFVSKTGGPIAIILCSNTKKCEYIYDLSRTLLGRNKLKISLVTYPFSHINAKYMDVLVTTPTILIDLLKTKAIHFKKLCHVILEDGDKILTRDHEIMNKTFDLIESMLSNRVYLKPVQLIICAEHWNHRIEKLVRKLSKVPMICIGNYLEAALYGKVQFSMRFINSACKELELKNLLKDTFKICKSVIVCKKEEIENIQTILMVKGIDTMVISEDLSKEEILYREEVWTQCKKEDYSVLVCTDFILSTMLTITSASLLIHYSLPSSWTQFVKRFGCLLENCTSPLDKQESKINCQTVVLCDEKCEGHMSKFFKYIDATELKRQLPDKFKDFSKDLRKVEEENKLKDNVGLCSNLKLFGMCSTNQCPWRHMVNSDLDVTNNLPQSGKIKFKIINIHDVTSYSVKLLQHVDVENKIQEFNDDSDITEDLTMLIKMSRKRVMTPVVGHKYAYYDMTDLEGVYYRCELLEIEIDCIKIKLLDKGDIITTMKSRLFKLPRKFKNKPRNVIDVCLANFIPPYNDENFSAKSFFHLKNLFEKHDFKNKIFTGDIHLQLENVLWLKNVYEEVTLNEKVIPGFQVTREILVLKLAERNENQLNMLYKLCEDAAIPLPVYEKPVKKSIKEEKKVEGQWAHLDSEINEVTFCAAVSPDEIYVRLNKFNQQLYILQKEIQQSLKKPNYPKLQNLEIGTVCLAKDPEGIDYARVIVRNIENGKALCFFADFGDEAVIDITELRYIHNKFITKLPFQSIQCRLYGIKPVLDEWQNDVCNILYDYATETNTDVFRLLFAKTCTKEKNVVNPKQNRYSILLKDGFGEKRVLINSLLIDCGLAVPTTEQIDDFEVSSEVFDTDETDEELEEILNICDKTAQVSGNVYVPDDQSVKKNFINEDMELFLIDVEGFFKSLLPSKEDSTSAFSKRELPAIQAAAPVDYYTPEVYWSQTEQHIKMDINLPDVDDYTLNVTKRTIINFKTVKNEKTYKLNLMLYQKVSSIQHSSMGQKIRVIMTKANNVEWPRLLLSKQRARNIHYDISTLSVDEQGPRRILEFPKMSDDEEDNDDIDVMYHVVSDLDSDFDEELAEDSN